MTGPVECLVEADIAAELPGLRLWSLELPAGDGPSPKGLRHRLREMSSRFTGAQAKALRSKPIPHAYRVFYRHIGLDPDVDRVPVEAMVVERLKHGGFRSASILNDALTVSLMETGVPTWALDADTLQGELELRRAAPDEPLGRGDEHGTWLPERPAGGRRPRRRGRRPVRRGRAHARRRAGHDPHEAVLRAGRGGARDPRLRSALDGGGHRHRHRLIRRVRTRFPVLAFAVEEPMALLEHHIPLVDPQVDEAAARKALRDQIARLELELCTAATSVLPNLPLPSMGGRVRFAGPRLLPLGILEQIRDELADRLAELRAERGRIADAQAEKRLLIERMLLDPGHYKYVRVRNEDIGEPGCKNWHVKPRLGIIGMLAGWWHVKISSGCPLALGPWRTPRPRTPAA